MAGISIRRLLVGLVVTEVLLTAVALSYPSWAAASSLPGPSTSDTSPVNLATPVNMANGMAHQSAIVRSGDARIEVLSPTLLRLEYSPSGNFENSPTVNAINRQMPVPAYTTQVSGGWLTVRTRRGHPALQGRIRTLQRRQHHRCDSPSAAR